MKIYVSHAKELDYANNLYIPLRNSSLNDRHEIVLPHEYSEEQFNSKEFIRTSCDVVIAEVSYRATGLGIELGWADAFGKKIICVCKKGSKVAGSVRALTDTIIEYADVDNMIAQLEKVISD